MSLVLCRISTRLYSTYIRNELAFIVTEVQVKLIPLNTNQFYGVLRNIYNLCASYILYGHHGRHIIYQGDIRYCQMKL